MALTKRINSMRIIEGGLETVPGYTFSAIKAGIRYADRLDYALIKPDGPCNAAGVFTKNIVSAAPVRLCRERIYSPVEAIAVNSTIANACTGEKGYMAALDITSDIERRLGLSEKSVLMCSTGVIGRQLPVEKMLSSHSSLVEGLNRSQGAIFSKAIMTTDTFPKSAAASFSAGGQEYVIAGTAKGSGMIAPDMATLLAFMITDAPIERKTLDSIFRRAVDKTINSITIDGDMSTNDTALILSPVSTSPISDSESLDNFESALENVLLRLSEMLVKDGEGATKLVRIHVREAATREDARRAARSIAQSALVKTAFFGEDPNWGRIAAAAGYSGAVFDQEKLTISFGPLTIFRNGAPVECESSELKGIMSQREFTVFVDLGAGTENAMFMTCDFSYDYVKINAEYTT